MTTASPSQSAAWDAVDILCMIDPDVGELRCVGDASSQHRKCQTVISQQDIREATRILTTLPSIADDNPTLQRQLANLASWTLCKRLHRKSPVQHDKVIARWTKDIERARTLHQSPLLPSGDQHTIQRTRQQQSNPTLHRPGQSRQAVPAASDSCTICLDHVGANGGRKILSCRHAFCRGCIDRWWNESRTCPICRDDGSGRVADTAQSPSRPAERRQNAEHVEERFQRDNASRTNPSLSPAREPPEQAREVSARLHTLGRFADAVLAAGNTSDPHIPEDCGICLEAIGQNGSPETLQCSHTFCSRCISQWLRQSSRCPYRCELGRHSHVVDERHE
jgi:hypothetical protein